MTILDYAIIAIVAVLFILAFKSYRKKPHCACGKSGGCSGNCNVCSFNSDTDNVEKPKADVQ